MVDILAYNFDNGIKEVLIYGGTIWGKAVCQTLLSRGIGVRGIFDKYQAGDVIENIQIKSPDDIQNYKDMPIIICSTRGFRSMCDFIEGVGYTQAYHAGNILSDVDWSLFHGWDVYESKEMVSKYMKYVHNYMGENLEDIELGEFNVIVTDLCNLKCDMCLARCTDVKKGKFYPIEELIDSFEKFLEQIHCLYKIIICGGEPLLHPELQKLIQFCIANEKIKRIEVLTNATIIPKRELLDALSNEKVRLVLDDYELSCQKIEEIIDVCKSAEVHCEVKKLEYWHDLTLMKSPKSDGDEELSELYRECTESQNYTLVDNKIVNCYRTFVDRQCGDWPETICDYYIDLKTFERGDKSLKSEMLKLMKKNYIQRCKYCVGTGKNAKVIPVAEQRKKE